MEKQTVAVVGASGYLGSEIVRALVAKGCQVRAVVRPTSDRTKLESLGVTDYAVADLLDPSSLRQALLAEPRPVAVVASAAGFSAHSAQTKGNNSRADTEGYRHLIDETKAAGIPRFILISILECDKAPKLPHFYQKFLTERYLVEKNQPYLALRSGAFLDRAQDFVAARVKNGIFPDPVSGAPMSIVYTLDLARYAAEAALDLPATELNQTVDIGCRQPATGTDLAKAFSQALGRKVVAKPVVPPFALPFLPFIAPFLPRLIREQVLVLRWLRKGHYVSTNTQLQKRLFGELPTIEGTVARYCRDKGLSL